MADQQPDPRQPPPTTALETTGAHPGVANLSMGLAPRTLDEGWRLAQLFARSGIVPKAYQKKPEDVLVAIQYGLEVGLMPAQALQSIAVINGKPSLYGDGFLGLIMASPLFQEHDEYYEVVVGDQVEQRDTVTLAELAFDTTTAVCTFKRRGKARPVTRRFSIADARKARTTVYEGERSRKIPLIEKEGPWTEYPARMLQMRARGFAGRDAFPDVLKGIKIREEVLDQEDAIEGEVTASVEVPREPGRRPRSRTAAAQTKAAEPPDHQQGVRLNGGDPTPVNAKPAIEPQQASADDRPFTSVDVTQDLDPLPPGAPQPEVLTVTNVEPITAHGRTWYRVALSDGRVCHTWFTQIAETARGARNVAAGVRVNITPVPEFTAAPFTLNALEVL